MCVCTHLCVYKYTHMYITCKGAAGAMNRITLIYSLMKKGLEKFREIFKATLNSVGAVCNY